MMAIQIEVKNVHEGNAASHWAEDNKVDRIHAANKMKQLDEAERRRIKPLTL